MFGWINRGDNKIVPGLVIANKTKELDNISKCVGAKPFAVYRAEFEVDEDKSNPIPTVYVNKATVLDA